MISVLILIAAVLVGFTVMRSLVDENRKLPPASTPEGKRARVIAGLVLIMLIGAFVFLILIGDNTGLTLQSIVIGAVVVFAPLLIRWKMK